MRRIMSYKRYFMLGFALCLYAAASSNLLGAIQEPTVIQLLEAEVREQIPMPILQEFVLDKLQGYKDSALLAYPEKVRQELERMHKRLEAIRVKTSRNPEDGTSIVLNEVEGLLRDYNWQDQPIYPRMPSGATYPAALLSAVTDKVADKNVLAAMSGEPLPANADPGLTQNIQDLRNAIESLRNDPVIQAAGMDAMVLESTQKGVDLVNAAAKHPALKYAQAARAYVAVFKHIYNQKDDTGVVDPAQAALPAAPTTMLDVVNKMRWLDNLAKLLAAAEESTDVATILLDEQVDQMAIVPSSMRATLRELIAKIGKLIEDQDLEKFTLGDTEPGLIDKLKNYPLIEPIKGTVIKNELSLSVGMTGQDLAYALVFFLNLHIAHKTRDRFDRYYIKSISSNVATKKKKLIDVLTRYQGLLDATQESPLLHRTFEYKMTQEVADIFSVKNQINAITASDLVFYFAFLSIAEYAKQVVGQTNRTEKYLRPVLRYLSQRAALAVQDQKNEYAGLAAMLDQEPEHEREPFHLTVSPLSLLLDGAEIYQYGLPLKMAGIALMNGVGSSALSLTASYAKNAYDNKDHPYACYYARFLSLAKTVNEHQLFTMCMYIYLWKRCIHDVHDLYKVKFAQFLYQHKGRMQELMTFLASADALHDEELITASELAWVDFLKEGHQVPFKEWFNSRRSTMFRVSAKINAWLMLPAFIEIGRGIYSLVRP